MKRPIRIKIVNEIGKFQSLPDANHSFTNVKGSGPALFMGLGHDLDHIKLLTSGMKEAYYIECPDFEKQVKLKNIPNNLISISIKEFHALLKKNPNIFIFTPNSKLFPSFWEPLLSAIKLAVNNINSRPKQKTVWFAGDNKSLLIPELSKSFERANFTYRVIEPDAMRRNPLSLLKQEIPQIFLSINGTGLSPNGDNFYLLKESGCKVCMWIVDNPFHILSNFKSNFCMEMDIFITDKSFIKILQNLGFKKVYHLPLATEETIFNENVKSQSELNNQTVFVGRSEFPKRNNYFAGCEFSKSDHEIAISSINNGIKPNYYWWLKKNQIKPQLFNKKLRDIGFKAEQSGLIWRTICLEKVENLTIFGDENWSKYLKADLRKPVDYYTTLPSIYKGAEFTINMTSPLLPEGLTQRNFDTWACGGFLISDKTKGSEIFPNDLVEECYFESPLQISGLIEKFRNSCKLKDELKKVWINEILTKHTYAQRVAEILSKLNY